MDHPTHPSPRGSTHDMSRPFDIHLAEPGFRRSVREVGARQVEGHVGTLEQAGKPLLVAHVDPVPLDPSGASTPGRPGRPGRKRFGKVDAVDHPAARRQRTHEMPSDEPRRPRHDDGRLDLSRLVRACNTRCRSLRTHRFRTSTATA